MKLCTYSSRFRIILPAAFTIFGPFLYALDFELGKLQDNLLSLHHIFEESKPTKTQTVGTLDISTIIQEQIKRLQKTLADPDPLLNGLSTKEGFIKVTAHQIRRTDNTFPLNENSKTLIQDFQQLREKLTPQSQAFFDTFLETLDKALEAIRTAREAILDEAIKNLEKIVNEKSPNITRENKDELISQALTPSLIGKLYQFLDKNSIQIYHDQQTWVGWEKFNKKLDQAWKKLTTDKQTKNRSLLPYQRTDIERTINNSIKSYYEGKTIPQETLDGVTKMLSEQTLRELFQNGDTAPEFTNATEEDKPILTDLWNALHKIGKLEGPL